MNPASRISIRWPLLVAAAVGLLVTGAGAAYLGLRASRPTLTTPSDSGAPPSAAATMPAADPGAAGAMASGSLPDVVVPLSREMVQRAGITVASVTRGGANGGVRAPAVVEPNIYKVVPVTPIVSGRVTRVMAELGQPVKSGQTLAQIYSPELAAAQARYVSARAELDAHDRELARTEKLTQIGAASRQELERVHAEHTAQRAAVQSAASQLRLLGLSAAAIETLDTRKAVESTVAVPAPLAGVITERAANVGLNVDPATPLFTIVDLSSVWIVADIYEQDFSRVKIGTPASIAVAGYPSEAIRGRVSYIDPQVAAATRTVKARIEVPNPGQALKLGMLAQVTFEGDGAGMPVIPRSAIQNVGDRTVVYVVNPAREGEFIEREVRLASATGQQVPILDGVKPGDLVVTEGSFHLRAERERLGLRSAAPATSAAPAGTQTPSRDSAQTARVVVNEQGFQPDRLTLRPGVPARLTFVRTTDKTCATEVVFPSLKITKALPLNEAVTIEFTPANGELAFACGMNMLRGTVVIE